MLNQQKRCAWFFWITIAIMLAALDISVWHEAAAAHGAVAENERQIVSAGKAESWIVKWKDDVEPDFVASSVVERFYDSRTVVARPVSGIAAAQWLAQWERSPQVEYMVANREVEIAATAPNDMFLDRQSYLVQTHTTEAWNQVNKNESVIIAIIDTGVDLEHPDLKANLIPGINLIQSDVPPNDDNGHGTNVAGVIAAVGNNSKGVAGMLWKTGIMPIKALEPSGRGDEDKLGAGIRYAVDHGAKIVVLSVGLLRNDSFLQETVQYAEDHNVLLVAATGNDEGRNIRFPAAYPTVLAVGGIREDNSIEERSNYGPEMDLVAPWSVFTTAVGGKYEYRDGTSMAAPQVAAAAAMVWAKYPEMKVHEVRNLLRQTTDDIAELGWDEHTGYGLLRVDRALSEPYKMDMYEPNDRMADAKPYSIGRMISAELSEGSDIDWFYFDAPYDGTMHLHIMSDLAAPSAVKLTHASGVGVFAYSFAPGIPLELKVTKGRNSIALEWADKQVSVAWPYRLSSSFTIYEDSFENNDKPYKAFKLPPRSQAVVGTFNHEGDEDWYAITYEQSGIVKVKVTTDTLRIDLVLTVQKQDERPVKVDDNDSGGMETYKSEVFPGTYYYKVGKLSSGPEIGEYVLQFEYEPRYIDPNEPNDRSFQATVVSFDTIYEGEFDKPTDVDYFKFTLAERSLVQLSLSEIPDSREVSLALQNIGLRSIETATNKTGNGSIDMSVPLDAGTYYVRLGTNGAFQDRMYKLIVHSDVLVGDYADIADHWAKEAIVYLAGQQVVEGYGDYRFEPERTISRAEAVTMLVKAFGYTQKQDVTFPDVPRQHWSYDNVSKAVQAGIVQGYPDGSFSPENALSRVEMAVLFAKAIGAGGIVSEEVPFADIDPAYWALPVLMQMKAEGWVTGYGDDTFRPDSTATRAEFAALLKRVVGQY